MTNAFVGGRRFLLVATLAMCAGAMAISACDDNSSNGTEGLSGGAITVTAAPTDLTVAQGASGSVEVTIGRSGEFTGPVTLKTGTPPTGIAVALTPSKVDEGVTTSTADVTVDPAAIPGTYHITIAGTASLVSTGQVTINVTVIPGEAPAPAAR
jgi:hypothetical protein